MTREEMAAVFHDRFDKIMELREAGQKEYAHTEDNALNNFDGVAELLGFEPEQVLMVYALKHVYGIAAWSKGLKSQRESVEGRIDDLIVYMFLLHGMIERRGKVPETAVAGAVEGLFDMAMDDSERSSFLAFDPIERKFYDSGPLEPAAKNKFEVI
jgi:hypothetical protein